MSGNRKRQQKRDQWKRAECKRHERKARARRGQLVTKRKQLVTTHDRLSANNVIQAAHRFAPVVNKIDWKAYWERMQVA
jgi:hypothetical protein